MGPSQELLAMARPVLMPLLFCAAVAALLPQSFCSFVPAPGSQQLRGAEQVATSVGLALMTSAPAQAASLFASDSPPQSRDEYFSRVLTGAGICAALAAFLVGFIITQAKRVVENKWLN